MKKLALAVLLTAMLGGCATFVNQGRQSITVTTREANGTEVDHAHCVLSSLRGVWTVDTPGSVVVDRGDEDLRIECTRPGHYDGTVTAISRANTEMFGNVMNGIIPGMAYDYESGAGLSYPESVTVVMGKAHTVDARPL